MLDTVHPDPAKGVGRIPLQFKFCIALASALVWTTLSLWLAHEWLADLADLMGKPLTYALIFAIVVLPGMVNAFLVTSMLLDRRPTRREYKSMPGITILIAAYNEEASILSTLSSIAAQDYPGPLDVIAINDGSVDATMERLRSSSGR